MKVEVTIAFKETTVSVDIYFMKDGEKRFSIRRIGDAYSFSVTVHQEKILEMLDRLAVRLNFPTEPTSVFTVTCDKETPFEVSGKKNLFRYLEAVAHFEPLPDPCDRCESPHPFESDLAAGGW